MSANAPIDDVQRRRLVERHRSFTEHFEKYEEPSGYIEVPSWHLDRERSYVDILHDLNEIANHSSCDPWTSYDQLVLERARSFDLFRYRSTTATAELLGPASDELSDWWELEPDGERLKIFRAELRAEGADAVFADWKKALSAAAEVGQSKPIRKRSSWTLADWRDPKQRAQGTKEPSESFLPFGKMTAEERKEALTDPETYFGERKPSGKVVVRRHDHRNLWRVPRGRKQWQAPSCPVASQQSRGEAQPSVELIPSLKFIIELWRNPQPTTTTQQAQAKTRRRVADFVKQMEERLQFVTLSGRAKRAAANRDLNRTRTILLNQQPLPGSTIVWSNPAKTRSPKGRPTRKVPTRTRRKRQLKPR